MNHIRFLSRRISSLHDSTAPYSSYHPERIRRVLESQLDGSYDLVVEPGRRDTAPAIMLACANLAFSQNVSFNRLDLGKLKFVNQPIEILHRVYPVLHANQSGFFAEEIDPERTGLGAKCVRTYYRALWHPQHQW